MKRFNIYQIEIKERTEGWGSTKEIHKLIFLKREDTMEDAEHWLKGNQEKYKRYTIIPEYYTTDFD